MSYRLWWRRNDGIGGHVWLSAADMRALTEEMLLQGMAWPAEALETGEEKIVFTAAEIEDALEGASDQALIADGKLWRDWLGFLDGAARNGGILIRT